MFNSFECINSLCKIFLLEEHDCFVDLKIIRQLKILKNIYICIHLLAVRGLKTHKWWRLTFHFKWLMFFRKYFGGLLFFLTVFLLRKDRNIPWTYMELHCKGERYRFSGERHHLLQTYVFFLYIRIISS